MKRKTIRRLGDGLVDQVSVEPDAPVAPVDVGTGGLENVERAVVQELEADVLQDVQRTILDHLKLVGGDGLKWRERVGHPPPRQLMKALRLGAPLSPARPLPCHGCYPLNRTL